MIIKIDHHGDLYAIILKAGFNEPGIHFITPDDFSQQLAYMHHPAGKQIQPHIHLPAPRQIQYTQEVLLIRRGRLRVDFYAEDRAYIGSRILEAGDTILLIKGGHGFSVLEELEMIEVKQGPYAGDTDKIRFPGIDSKDARVQ
jgi:mannose-6-phosphate isomerase-like protein (cupin superfamily)